MYSVKYLCWSIRVLTPSLKILLHCTVYDKQVLDSMPLGLSEANRKQKAVSEPSKSRRGVTHGGISLANPAISSSPTDRKKVFDSHE